MIAEDGANRLCNIPWTQHGESDLVKQRMKCVVVIAVYDRDIGIGGTQGFGCIQPRKTRAQDNHLRPQFGALGVSHFVCLGIDYSHMDDARDQF